MSYAKLPNGEKTPPGPLEFAPDFVVEVKSPSDRLANVTDKMQDFINAGVKVVLGLDPELEFAGVFTGESWPHRYHNGDILTFPEVSPGFSVPVKRFFE